MSNALAIAAVTAALRNLLSTGITADPELAGATVTTFPPDVARDDGEGNQLNLFLYQTAPNAAWRNMDMPGQVRPGETGQPPLALDLFYLLTVYGQDDQGVPAHRVLGRAMSVLHDHPLLGSEEIEAAVPGNDLHQQVERVRITPHQLSLDDLSKLWTTFQVEYRVSAAYQVSVVLIESTRTAVTPLPVLTIGTANRGVDAQPDLTPRLPTLTSVQPNDRQQSAVLGDVLTVSGHHLEADDLTVRFTSPRLENAIEVDPESGRTSTQFRAKLEVNPATDPATWPAGFYTISAAISRAGEPDRVTNALPFTLAPRITSQMPTSVTRDAGGTATLVLNVSPEVRPEQRASLLLGSREVAAEAHPAQTDELTFVIPDAPPGEHFVRLRIDGIDNLLVDRSVTPPVFDPTQKVTIT